ncbi:MAG TPA: TIGR02680 family protein, partial [Acidimicrobiales bacterium]|nr:TIGR02680 family protein [Acidimicrobiales bacterium]
MGGRWTLSRAGICNVYQYDDEVISFAGGRLLLRGVNGSGKSTAMNMLLPFLLDADTRRIDAAGEQAGVLKSWMLAGRDDPQPVGYLWLEILRDDGDGSREHLSFGCGVRANRASDTVTTWWFVTSKRPAIDFAVVDDRRPLSADALRQAIDPDPVFRHDQRGAYRDELRRRLYGGADLDQHIRLLHIVRSPRVGDRVDVDLPAHLHAALPALSDRALDDAAGPLDELEEHRRNVEHLRRTASALEGITAVYADYVRADLHRRAAAGRELVATATAAARAHRSAEQRATALHAANDEATRHAVALADDERRLRGEADALRESPAYADGALLNDRRSLVASLERAAQKAAGAQRSADAARAKAEADERQADAAAHQDHSRLAGLLDDLTAAVVDAGLPVAPPSPPAPDATGADTTSAGLTALTAAATHRRGDIDEVRAALRVVAAAEAEVRAAEAADRLAGHAADAADADLADRRRQRSDAVAAWRDAVAAWYAPGEPPDLTGDLLARRRDVADEMRAAADASIGEHQREVATLGAALDAATADAATARGRLDELEAATLPAPPSLPWQRTGRTKVFAEAVDFRPHLDDHERAGLEAAMEAAGLLAAEVTDDGALHTSDGTLVARADAPVAAPLSGLLTTDDPAVDAVLAGISTDVGSAATTVVTTDGRFRIGTLAGRHTKTAAAYVGLAARRQALEAARVAARAALADADAEVATRTAVLEAARAALAGAVDRRDRLPRLDDVEAAVAAATAAEGVAQRAATAAAEAHRTAIAADAAHADAVDKSRRAAADLSLPADHAGLDRVARAIEDVARVAGDARAALTVLVRSADGLRAATTRHADAAEAAAAAAAEATAASAAHQREAASLATLEDTVGIAFAEVAAALQTTTADLEATLTALDAARATQVRLAGELAAATAAAKSAQEEVAGAEARAAAFVPRLRASLAARGVAAVATAEPALLLAPVEATAAGLDALATSIAATVAAPSRPDITADSVRQSLRQRRDTLGAGWDADDRTPDPAGPMLVDVVGPSGTVPLAEAGAVVGRDLASLTSLLSAEQDRALRNLLTGLVASEVAEKVLAAAALVTRMNARLDQVTTAHGIGVSLRWKRKDDLSGTLATLVELMALPSDMRDESQHARLRSALTERLDEARATRPDATYRDLVAEVLDYRDWFDLAVLVRRPGRNPERLTRRTALSEGEKKVVSYLPLFAAVAASCDSLAESAPACPRFVLLDDAFAKVSEDNHPKLFGLLVELDLDVIATSERLWGTFATVPELAITEVLRDADLGVIVLEHS